MNDEKVERLRDKIKELKKDLEKATLEKGLAAEENKDIRENFAYDYWDQQETNLTVRIHRLMNEIRELTHHSKPKPKAKSANTASKKRTKKERPRIEIAPHKWM